MRRIRALSVIIFILSVGIFVYVKILAVNNVDTNGPEIHMTEKSIEVSVGAEKSELLAGVTATDAKDGDVSASFVIESMTNFAERGRRTIIFAAFDSDSNVTKATREIIYNDYTPPAFELSGPLYLPLNTTSLTGTLTVKDVLDGDLTQNIKIYADEEVKVDKEGDYSVIFSVANSAGDTVQLPVTVTIYNPSEQQRLPAISLSQYLIHIKRGEAVDPWLYVDEVSYRGVIYKPEKNSAGKWILAEEIDSDHTDDDDELNLTEERKYLTDIEVNNPVDTNTPGVYEITYRVADGEENEKNTGTMRLVVVVDE